jgi:3-dehydrosphinganine reductase
LTSAPECVRVIDEVEAWNGSPPDIVWCCAGTSEPTLFVETSAELLESQMKSNYFSSAFMAHAVMQRWLQPLEKSASAGKDTAPDRHLIFTSSVVAFFTFIGYTPYSPAKAALRSLSDTLSQEMNLYQAAHPNGRRVRLHTIFPGTILSEGYEQENLVKPDITKSLEEFDKKRTPTVIAKRSIAGLESGLELITTDLLADFARRGMLGSSSRAGFLRGLVDTLLASLMCVMILVSRMDMDSKTRAWGRKHGTAGRKKAEDSSPA